MSVRRNTHARPVTPLARQARDMIETLLSRGLTNQALQDIFGGGEIRKIMRGVDPSAMTVEMLAAMVERTEPKS